MLDAATKGGFEISKIGVDRVVDTNAAQKSRTGFMLQVHDSAFGKVIADQFSGQNDAYLVVERVKFKVVLATAYFASIATDATIRTLSPSLADVKYWAGCGAVFFSKSHSSLRSVPRHKDVEADAESQTRASQNLDLT